MSKIERTSIPTILTRFGLFGWSLGVTMFYAATALGIAVAIGPIIVGAVVGVGLLIAFYWLGMKLISMFFFEHDPDYKQWIDDGGDPFFHAVCPPPFNTDSFVERAAGGSSDTLDLEMQSEGQTLGCPSCHNLVREPSPGDFVNFGVICPFCEEVIHVSK